MTFKSNLALVKTISHNVLMKPLATLYFSFIQSKQLLHSISHIRLRGHVKPNPVFISLFSMR